MRTGERPHFVKVKKDALYLLKVIIIKVKGYYNIPFHLNEVIL